MGNPTESLAAEPIAVMVVPAPCCLVFGCDVFFEGSAGPNGIVVKMMRLLSRCFENLRYEEKRVIYQVTYLPFFLRFVAEYPNTLNRIF